MTDLDDLMDRLVAEYADQVSAGRAGDREQLLVRVPAPHRPALDRCLRMIDQGLASSPGAQRALGPGAELAGFRIVDVAGRGGMSIVYRAEQLELDRLVALKVLRPGLALERRHVDRFHREALAVARLNHPNIVQIHAVGEADGYHYIAMEFVDGPHLGQVLAALPADRKWTAADLALATGDAELAGCSSYDQALATLLAPVARAVGVAHDLGIVHRDIKPSNILLHRDGRVKIADFGLVKGEGDLEMSLTGEPLGTPYYMSPEQVAQSEHAVDARTDVYSLGVTLYEALTGRRPFEGRSLVAIFDAIRNESPTPVRQLLPERSKDAQAVVSRAMARERSERYRSALELASDLVALSENRPTQARAQQSGPLRAALSGFVAMAFQPGPYEYRSPRSFLGWPLIHVNKGYASGGGPRLRVAKGWIAWGHVSIGLLSFGNVALGGISFGGLSLGLLAAWGGLALGGVLAMGGLAVAGGLALGGAAIGYAAFGGFAAGRYAMGGKAVGTYRVWEQERDQVAIDFFREHLPILMSLVESMGLHL